MAAGIMTRPETLTDIQRAARYYLQHHAFAGKVTGQAFGFRPLPTPAINLCRIEENLSAAHLRPGRHLRRAPVVAGLPEALRPRAYLLLRRPTVLADRGLWRAVRVRPVRAVGRGNADDAKGKVMVNINGSWAGGRTFVTKKKKKL